MLALPQRYYLSSSPAILDIAVDRLEFGEHACDSS